MSCSGAHHWGTIEQAGQPGHQGIIERCLQRPRLFGHDSIRSGQLLLDLGYGCAERWLAGGACVEPGCRRASDCVHPTWLDADLPDCREAAVRFGCSTRCQHGTGAADHRVPAIAQPGGAGVVGLTGNFDAPPAVRP